MVTEPFRQWVIEDLFAQSRPPLEEVGAQLVTDVQPHETMKLRLLNASHSAMGYLGYLAGYRFIHEVMEDEHFRAFIRRMMDEEVTPLLHPVPRVDLGDYKRTLLERFSNPKIRDQVTRICLDGSAKVPKFLLPSISDALSSGRPYRLLTLALAGWFRYLLGVDERGTRIEIEDARAHELRVLAAAGRENPRPLLGLRVVFGDLGQDEAFVAELEGALHEVYAHGAREAPCPPAPRPSRRSARPQRARRARPPPAGPQPLPDPPAGRRPPHPRPPWPAHASSRARDHGRRRSRRRPSPATQILEASRSAPPPTVCLAAQLKLWPMPPSRADQPPCRDRRAYTPDSTLGRGRAWLPEAVWCGRCVPRSNQARRGTE